MLRLASMPRRQPRSRHEKKQRYERAARLYLERCYAARTAARVSEFAEFVGLTRPHLTTELSHAFGVRPRQFLRDLQLEHAATLLRATPARVSDIALACGFGTVNTFHRSFAGKYGCSPERYREYAAAVDD